MKTMRCAVALTRALAGAALLSSLFLTGEAAGQREGADPLPSWNDGPAKQAILRLVRATTDKASPRYVPPEKRIATFDQDGTLWVEQPIYTQVLFALDRVVVLAPQHPEWKEKEPFKSVLAGDKAAMAKFTTKDLEEIVFATHTGMTPEEFQATVKDWMAGAKHPRWGRPGTELVYQPMLEVMRYLRASGYKTYIATGGGQAFVRAYAEEVYGVPPDQVIGSALETRFTYDKQGKGVLLRAPKLLLDNDQAGKPEDIYLFTGRRPLAAFGNSSGDRQMLEYAQGGDGARLMLLVLHDDAKREYAYGPARGLPESKVGTFSQELYDDAKARGWVVVSMKDDWKRVFPFEGTGEKATLKVLLRADAALTIDGAPTAPTGPVRSFVSDEMKAGSSYEYELRATWDDGGQKRSAVKKVTVKPGGAYDIDLTVADR